MSKYVFITKEINNNLSEMLITDSSVCVHKWIIIGAHYDVVKMSSVRDSFQQEEPMCFIVCFQNSLQRSIFQSSILKGVSKSINLFSEQRSPTARQRGYDLHRVGGRERRDSALHWTRTRTSSGRRTHRNDRHQGQRHWQGRNLPQQSGNFNRLSPLIVKHFILCFNQYLSK